MTICQVRNISFLNVEETIKWSDQAARLVKMDNIITSEPNSRTPEGRQSIIDCLDGFVQKILKTKTLPEANGATLESKVVSLYEWTDINQSVTRLCKDIISVLIPPIQSSALGMNGPTYLISYPRDGIYTGVLKLTTKAEFSSGVLLGSFLQLFNETHIKVPSASFIDVNQRSFMSSSTGTAITPLEAKSQRKLGSNFYRFLNPRKSDIPSNLLEDSGIKTNQVMISEKVSGANLRDFVMYGAYSQLTDSQKESLLRSIAKVVTLDLFVLGHTDRIHQMATDFIGFSQVEPSNIGNLMIKSPEAAEESPILYAIDNGTIEIAEENSLYNTFLKGFVDDTRNAELLEQNMKKSLGNAFKKDSKYALPVSHMQEMEDHLADSLRDASTEIAEKKALIKAKEEESAIAVGEQKEKLAGEIEELGYDLYDLEDLIKERAVEEITSRPVDFMKDVTDFNLAGTIREAMNVLNSMSLEAESNCYKGIETEELLVASVKSRVDILKTRGAHA